MPPRVRTEPLNARRAAAVLLGLSLALGGCAHGKSLSPGEALTPQERHEAIRRAGVWSPTDIRSVDLKAGPDVAGAFAPNQWVTCEYKETGVSGHSPKFACETTPGHEVKVKYGPRNAEVFGEVLATRLFWALGFPADRMYPVRVRCHGCPRDPKRQPGNGRKGGGVRPRGHRAEAAGASDGDQGGLRLEMVRAGGHRS